MSAELAGTVGRHGVLLTLSYEGGLFCGFARQARERTIAGELEGAIAVLDPRASSVRGVSRTDAGVHARAQLVAFDASREIDPRGWVLGLNRELPREIAVVRAARTEALFEPRRRVLRKTYVYRVLESPTREPLIDRYAWRVPYRLNQLAMRDAARSLSGNHDFRAFRGAADRRDDTVRHIFRIDVTRSTHDPRITEVSVCGDRFLYNMLRIIAGTLVDIGRGHRESSAFEQALGSGLRSDLGVTAPPHGLTLEHIELDDMGCDPWPAASKHR
jgi:tRNA pseudouridine38-40 synthase